MSGGFIVKHENTHTSQPFQIACIALNSGAGVSILLSIQVIIDLIN